MWIYWRSSDFSNYKCVKVMSCTFWQTSWNNVLCNVMHHVYLQLLVQGSCCLVDTSDNLKVFYGFISPTLLCQPTTWFRKMPGLPWILLCNATICALHLMRRSLYITSSKSSKSELRWIQARPCTRAMLEKSNQWETANNTRGKNRTMMRW